MSEVVDGFRAEKEFRRQAGRRNRSVSTRAFHKARDLAAKNGMVLRRHTEAHYSLRTHDAAWNLYPGNQRIYVDKAHRKTTPFLHVDAHPWSLLDVVKAAVEQKGISR